MWWLYSSPPPTASCVVKSSDSPATGGNWHQWPDTAGYASPEEGRSRHCCPAHHTHFQKCGARGSPHHIQILLHSQAHPGMPFYIVCTCANYHISSCICLLVCNCFIVTTWYCGLNRLSTKYQWWSYMYMYVSIMYVCVCSLWFYCYMYLWVYNGYQALLMLHLPVEAWEWGYLTHMY